MAEPFLSEIRMMSFNFAPRGWAFCNGTLLPINQNQGLFSLLGTTYGGDGKSNFALPNLQGCVPMHWGQGPGLSLRDIGETGGSDTVSLLESEIPSHSHGYQASQSDSNDQSPENNLLAGGIGIGTYAPASGATMTNLAPVGITPAGGSQPHNNLQPYLTLNFCIALQGVYPPRT